MEISWLEIVIVFVILGDKIAKKTKWPYDDLFFEAIIEFFNSKRKSKN